MRSVEKQTTQPAGAAGVQGESPPDKADRVVVLGKIASPFGVHGWVKVNSFTDPPENILDYRIWQLGGASALSGAAGWTPVRVEEGRVTGKGVLAKLAGIASPEEARTRTGLEVGVWRSELPHAAPGEYYWTDLEGFAALTPEGESLGNVDHFRSTPTGPVVIVRGEREHWIPFVKDRIVRVEMEACRIVLDWPADL
jgi:16S rRNA processing protein RimM